jgi:hypothetical protein
LHDVPASTANTPSSPPPSHSATATAQVDLSDALTSLDEHNTTLVLEAIAHA